MKLKKLYGVQVPRGMFDNLKVVADHLVPLSDTRKHIKQARKEAAYLALEAARRIVSRDEDFVGCPVNETAVTVNQMNTVLENIEMRLKEINTRCVDIEITEVIQMAHNAHRIE